MGKKAGIKNFFTEKICNRKNGTIFCILSACLSMLPLLILGEDSIVTVHDQLDGELLTYILNAKHLFDGALTYPELMNGIPREGVVSPAPLFVPVFRILPVFQAYLFCTFIIRIVSSVSMFYLLDELTDMKVVSFMLAVFFMFLPFYTVYGLCIPGLPMLGYAFLRFKREKFEWFHYIFILFYVLSSSLALIGFAVIVVSFGVAIVALIRKKNPMRYFAAFLVMIAGYVLENIPLVKQLLGLREGFVSNKEEMVRSSVGFITNFKNVLLFGDDYAETFQICYLSIIVIALLMAVCFLIKNRKNRQSERYNLVEKEIYLCIFVMVLAICSGFLGSSAFTDYTNNKSGVIHNFNFSRVSWLMPPIWIVTLGMSIKIIVTAEIRLKKAKAVKTVATVFISLCYMASLAMTVYNNDIRYNIMKIVKNGDYYMLSWKQFFAEDLYSQVSGLIPENKENYRVVSIGIYPVIASYNGFYCLDAYSNNYSLEYKHEFRKVIEPQLEKSDYLEGWFDNWGNRCYIVMNENLDYFQVEKKWGNWLDDYELNFEQLKNMGCEYIIAAEYLCEPEKYGLELLNTDGNAIETQDSYFRLFVYHIK